VLRIPSLRLYAGLLFRILAIGICLLFEICYLVLFRIWLRPSAAIGNFNRINIMGKTTEKVIVKNFGDILMLDKGLIKKNEIRSTEIEAIVDTGAAYLCLPPNVIDKLGLLSSHSRKVTTANGNVERRIFSGAVILILGRDIEMQVMENDATTPPLIGYLVLETMDLIVDTRSKKLIPNPEHDGNWVMDLY